MNQRLNCVGVATLAICLCGATAAHAEEDSATPIEFHGFVSQGFIKTTANNYLAKSKPGSFEFSEVGLNVTKQLSQNLRAGMQIFAHDLGPIGNYHPQFDWFYLDYQFDTWLGLRVGRTKVPFGLFNEVNDIDSARVPILLPQSVYPIQNRDYLLAQNGLELYGELSLGGAGSLEYRLYGGTIFLDTSNQPLIRDFSVPYLVGGRVMWTTPLEGLELGGSVQGLRLDFDYVLPAPAVTAAQMAGTVPEGFNGTVKVKAPVLLWVASALYQPGDLLLASEYSRWHAVLNSGTPSVLPNNTTDSERFYAMASYRINRWFVPGAYYSLLFPDTRKRRDRENQQHDIAATARFDLTENWLLKLEGHYMFGTAALLSTQNANIPLRDLTRVWGVLMVKTTAYF